MPLFRGLGTVTTPIISVASKHKIETFNTKCKDKKKKITVEGIKSLNT